MDKYTWADKQSETAFPIAKAGYPFIFAAAFTTAVLAVLGFKFFAFLAIIITFFICFFFRDPDRVTPDVEGVITSPADGTIIFAKQIKDSPFYSGPCLKISIFMSVFNVHVNRIPYDGKIAKIAYNPGEFFPANLDKASLKNEHNAVFLTTDNGKELCFIQIAGLIARRIICMVNKDDEVKRGQRYGMICFGSRLDVYIPPECSLNVKIGEKVRAGTSVLGCFERM